ncbi:MAG: N-acetylmuramoyl-L-alanine amidase [Propionibacteriales bacterium]|nr:N-acetylmuramoyl-L-alanine amidase [Propionibacteriales bacterium]
MKVSRRVLLASAGVGAGAVAVGAIGSAWANGLLQIPGAANPSVSPSVPASSPPPSGGAPSGSSDGPLLAVPRPTILPRSVWAGQRCPVMGQLAAEDDVRFLLVHHTEGRNDYRRDEVASMLRGWYSYHTGPAKKWPDIAYNFLIDRYGRIWEGRHGSLNSAVRGSATGGSQGFDQKICFMGTFNKIVPTPAAMRAGVTLIAWLAARERINLDAGTSVSFVSRGSNRWPRGTVVTTDPVAGHRDMSQTSCPGDKLYPLVRSWLRVEAAALVAEYR